MNIKVAAFSALTLSILGYFMADGLPANGNGTFSRQACLSSISKQADRDLFKEIDPGSLCTCLADLKLTRENASYKTLKPCLDKTLREPIFNACEKDEAAKKALRDRPKSPDDELDMRDQPIGPAMNCECVTEKSTEWVWHNFDASLKSKALNKDDALLFADGMVNECRWN